MMSESESHWHDFVLKGTFSSYQLAEQVKSAAGHPSRVHSVAKALDLRVHAGHFSDGVTGTSLAAPLALAVPGPMSTFVHAVVLHLSGHCPSEPEALALASSAATVTGDPVDELQVEDITQLLSAAELLDLQEVIKSSATLWTGPTSTTVLRHAGGASCGEPEVRPYSSSDDEEEQRELTPEEKEELQQVMAKFAEDDHKEDIERQKREDAILDALLAEDPSLFL